MASSVALSEAREHLDELLERAERAEEIVIERQGRLAMKLVSVGYEAVGERGWRANPLNSAMGEIWLADDWDSPETNKEIADIFENPNLFLSRRHGETSSRYPHIALGHQGGW